MQEYRTFTQEDPIGLAGGLNLYGFANGDPVNFSDPLGLASSDADRCPPDCEEADPEPGSSEWYAARIAMGEGSRVINEAGGLLSTCGESLLCNGVLAVGTLIGPVLRIGGALQAANTGMGSASVTVGSATEAGIAGRLWTLGGRAILDRTTGAQVGRVSADLTRVYRAAVLKGSGAAAANLERWLTIDGVRAQVANVHLLIP